MNYKISRFSWQCPVYYFAVIYLTFFVMIYICTNIYLYRYCSCCCEVLSRPCGYFSCDRFLENNITKVRLSMPLTIKPAVFGQRDRPLLVALNSEMHIVCTGYFYRPLLSKTTNYMPVKQWVRELPLFFFMLLASSFEENVFTK